jgi:hypothetical protein
MPAAETIRWKGREATRLANGVIELITLTQGGHLASLGFAGEAEKTSGNVFWEPPWPTYDDVTELPSDVLKTYGPPGVDLFMAGYTGHCLCLDFFGEPSREQIAAGLRLHGEAAAEKWSVTGPAQTENPYFQSNVALPTAGLEFERQVQLRGHESVVYIQETVRNTRDADHACDWVQHATFGPPFLQEGESTLAVSGARAKTWPLDYENGMLLEKDKEFNWPFAPCEDERKVIDLRQPFSTQGRGLVATTLLDPRRETQYLVAVNWRTRVGVGYCFRRRDFPWMTIWEENCSRQSTPWNGRTQARGMEFGSTPLPLGSVENSSSAPLFDTPSQCVIPGGGAKTARYLLFLFTAPDGMQSIQNVELEKDAIILSDELNRPGTSIKAQGCADFLSETSPREVPLGRIQKS